MAYLQNFTHETGRTVLLDILKTLNQAENTKRIAEAKGTNKDNMLNLIQFVFPVVMQIQMDVIKRYGFPANREGLVQFSQLIRELEEDAEIAKLRQQIRSIYLPPMVINTSNDVLV